jgi:hypothetical protein
MHPLVTASQFKVHPTNSGGGHTAEVTDSSGSKIGAWTAAGDILDDSGTKILSAPVKWEAPRHGPISVEMQIADGSGSSLGSARVAKYTLGPRAKKLTVAISDIAGTQVGRIEPVDKKGEQLAVSVGEIPVASVDVTEVKAGFLRKKRIYAIQVTGSMSDSARPLVIAALLRYDALLDGVLSAAMKDSTR